LATSSRTRSALPTSRSPLQAASKASPIATVASGPNAPCPKEGSDWHGRPRRSPATSWTHVRGSSSMILRRYASDDHWALRANRGADHDWLIAALKRQLVPGTPSRLRALRQRRMSLTGRRLSRAAPGSPPDAPGFQVPRIIAGCCHP
jgi:hypothetical protein